MNDFTFPNNFLWGAATAAHQVEGNNINSETWVLEHLPGSPYAEPSGDACDHYRRFPEDIALLSELGFNAYRFSVEWARIEPEEGVFSVYELDHYRRMLAECHEHGIKPVVTLHHFTSPRWLMREGGWLDEGTPDRFARYCERVSNHFGDLLGAACTFNEPNLALILSKLLPADMQKEEWWRTAARAFGVSPDRLGLFQFVTSPKMREVILAAHRSAYDILHGGPGDFPVGLTLALPDIQAAPGGEDEAAAFRRSAGDVYLERLTGDDFVGVQNYGRVVITPEGLVAPAEGTERNDMGEEFYPEGLAGAVRHAARVARVPVYVTENGIATTDDDLRMRFYRRALRSLADCLESQIDVRGYFCWSALDNFEWIRGYRPKFGIIAVDRQTQARTPKESGRWVGSVARTNRLSSGEADSGGGNGGNN